MLQQSLENVLQITLHQRIPGKVRERCHNVERKLWKCSLLTLLQRNPGTLFKCWATVVKMLPPDVASTSCTKVAKTLPQHCHNVELWKGWHMKLLQHIPGKFQECCYNVAAKRKKTSPQHYGNINRQRRNVMIFTMLWQPFCNTGKSA